MSGAVEALGGAVLDEGSGTGAGLRTADALALHLFHRLRLRSEVDRWHVYRALGPRSSADGSARHELSLASINRCAEDLERLPSVREYGEWREAQTRPDQWVSAPKMRRYFGSWTAALQAAGLEPEPDPLTATLRGLASPFTKAELVGALQTCASDLGTEVLASDVFFEWARRELERPPHAKRLHRVPLSLQPFRRLFGGWAMACAATGLGPPVSERREPRPPARPRSAFRAPPGGFPVDVLARALREWASTTPKDDPLALPAFKRWAAATAQLRAAGDADAQFPTPNANTYLERFGGWWEALAAAGLMRPETAARLRCAGPRGWGEAELVAAFALYIAECPQPAYDRLLVSRYMSWREERLSRLPLPSCPLPSIKPLHKAVSLDGCLDSARRIRGAA